MDVGDQAQGPSTPSWHGYRTRDIPKKFPNKKQESNATPSPTKAKLSFKNMLRERKSSAKDSDFSCLPSLDSSGSTSTLKRHAN